MIKSPEAKSRKKEALKKWRAKNQNRLKQYSKEYRLMHLDEIKEKQKIWREDNPEYQKNWDSENREKRRAWWKQWAALNARAWRANKMQSDPQFRLRRNSRKRVWDALKNRAVKSAKTKELIGCSWEHLKSWLEFWMKPGMTWENYGEWHIDHKKPCSSFDLTKSEEQKKCFHYTNLEPLWAFDNLSKGAR